MGKNEMKVERINISKVSPYWNNPRDNEEAVKSVMQSIKDYGYNSPIVVDKKYVIIAGDTRYKALKRLNYEQISVVVADLDEKKAKEYRIIDNKTSEKAMWNQELLIPELRAVDLSAFHAEFPELKLNPINLDLKKIDDVQVQKASEGLENKFEQIANTRQEKMQEITCPECGHEFEIM